MKARWFQKLSLKKCAYIGFGLLVVADMIQIFFLYHVPIKGYYDSENQELVISPGLLYTLEGYRTQVIIGDEFLVCSSEPGDRDLRFSLTLADSACTEIRITCCDSLTGKSESRQVEVMQQLHRSYGSYEFQALGSGINCAFSIYAGK